MPFKMLITEPAAASEDSSAHHPARQRTNPPNVAPETAQKKCEDRPPHPAQSVHTSGVARN